MTGTDGSAPRVLAGHTLDPLLAALAARGYRTVGPRVRDGAIVYDTVTATADLPRGIGDTQAPGHYRLVARDDGALFGYTVGATSWKRFLHPPAEVLVRMERTPAGLRRLPPPDPGPPLAFLGVRACDVAAIRVQDRVLAASTPADPGYAARRARLFIVAVDCAQAAATCFCTSFGTGPGATEGFDLALTELPGDGGYRLVARAGSPAGAALLAALPGRDATAAELAAAAAVPAATAATITRRLPTAGLKDALQAASEHPHWDAVAERCLACANCTQACPTCYCTSTQDRGSVDGSSAERVRAWDSCFNADFSFVHGGPVRHSTAARYRQWLTHKLAGWVDQFGESGCVGCGRCIAWCPVGIDLTAEVAALRAPAAATTGGTTDA